MILGEGRLKLRWGWPRGLGVLFDPGWLYLLLLVVEIAVQLDPHHGWRPCVICGRRPRDGWFRRADSSGWGIVSATTSMHSGRYCCADCSGVTR